MTSSFAVSGFMATRKSISFLRPMYPRWLARMVYQVGRPAMFDGNRFFPDTGTPIWKMDRSSTKLAVWLPEPLTVATWMLKSLVTEEDAVVRSGAGAGRVELMLESSGGRKLAASTSTK